MKFSLVVLSFASAVVVQPLADSDVLEPSIQNEVDHAIAKGERVAKVTKGQKVTLPFPTNGMSRTDMAIRLISSQKYDGRWHVGTNDVTAAAVEILKSL